jgi:hypothetical protein
MRKSTSKRNALIVWLLLRVGERIALRKVGGRRGSGLRRFRKVAISVFALALVGALVQRKRSTSGRGPSSSPVSLPPVPAVERSDDGPADLPERASGPA